MFATLAWLVLLLPLFSAGIITIFTRNQPGRSGGISIAAALGALGCVVFLFSAMSPADYGMPIHATWLSVGNLQVDIGLHLDRLSLGMLLVVTGVGSLIHIYSWGYMSGDRSFGRFFACLSLFMFSMIGIVLADNFLMMFIFWELVGISSYLLIGFWYERGSAADACKKAFLCNRIGDFGFLLGILLVWSVLGSLNFEQLRSSLGEHATEFAGVATAAGLLIFCGAVGKSAQFPLHVWLPDAMEGPTPVSALIHAATMVAAGVYMLCRVFFLLDATGSHALEMIAWVGGFTSLLAALIAVQQNDIKRILAYSTLSQLGYMVMSVGLAGPTASMFHLTTHAFFKALLFLGAGSIIHSLHHEQNIWQMGGLKKKMKVTYWTFLVGTLAICGVPPLSGFYSKDGILAQALDHNIGLFAVAAIVAILTAFYMFRLVYVVFAPEPKSEAASHAHESPNVMLWPLRILAVFSIIGGFIGIENIYAAHFLPQGSETVSFWAQVVGPIRKPGAMAVGLGVLAIGWFAARSLYRNQAVDPLPKMLGGLSRAMRNRFYFDELYEHYLVPYTQEAAAKFADALDRWIIGGLMVRGVHGTTEFFGRILRMVQTGNLQTYAFLLAAGVAWVLYYVLVR